MSTTAEKIIRDAGIRVTKPRIIVYDYILTNKNHPTCDEIYQGICSNSQDKLSYATVYNVTEKLCEENLLTRLNPPTGERRYDGTLSFHGHFYCERCGRVEDFDCDPEYFSTATMDFDLSKVEVTATGLCKSCKT